MSSRHTYLKIAGILLFLLPSVSNPQGLRTSQKQVPRGIVSDDFTNARPKSRKRIKKSSRPYRLASTTSGITSVGAMQIGLTMWKLQPARFGSSNLSQFTNRGEQSGWISTRVESDTRFYEGDRLRLSVESPRAGYLYVVNRDWLADGSAGVTNLIYPIRGEDNYLSPGKLIDIPAQNQQPFKANPAANQAGELLTFIVTSSPLPLSLSNRPLPISSAQLLEWEQRWGGPTDRFEMIDGAGQTRTIEEDKAAAPTGTRQLTRDDPSPQTIFVLTPKNNDGLLFNMMLFYAR